LSREEYQILVVTEDGFAKSSTATPVCALLALQTPFSAGRSAVVTGAAGAARNSLVSTPRKHV